MTRPTIPGRCRLLAAVAVAWLWPNVARGYRPFDSTDAAVAGKDELELELQPIGWEGGAAGRSLISSAVVNWGAARRLELVLEGTQALPLDRGSGERTRREDAALGAKGVLREGSLQGATGFSVAAELGAIAPGAAAGEGVGARGALLLSRRLEVGTAHLNGRVEWTPADGPRLGAGLVVEGPEAWAVRPVAELLAEGARGRSVLLGAIWRLRDGLSLDAAVRAGHEGGGGVVELRVGVTWAFALARIGGRDPRP